jgi:hypothetical protein
MLTSIAFLAAIFIAVFLLKKKAALHLELVRSIRGADTFGTFDSLIDLANANDISDKFLFLHVSLPFFNIDKTKVVTEEQRVLRKRIIGTLLLFYLILLFATALVMTAA